MSVAPELSLETSNFRPAMRCATAAVRPVTPTTWRRSSASPQRTGKRWTDAASNTYTGGHEQGYGAIQRRLLAKLAENTADPLEDERATLSYRTEANTRSWTPLSDLAVDGTHSAIESARRALHTLAEDGVVALASRSTLTADGVTRHVSIARLTNPELDAAVEAVRIEVRAAHNARVGRTVPSASRTSRSVRPTAAPSSTPTRTRYEWRATPAATPPVLARVRRPK